MIFPYWNAYRATREFIIESSRLGQTFEGFLSIRQRVQGRVTLSPKNGPVQLVRARFCDHIDHASRISPVISTEIICRDLIFLHELRVGKKYGGACHGIVVVVLPVNLLVVIPSAKSIHGEPLATVGI